MMEKFNLHTSDITDVDARGKLIHRCSGQNRHLDIKDNDSCREGRSELDRVGQRA